MRPASAHWLSFRCPILSGLFFRLIFSCSSLLLICSIALTEVEVAPVPVPLPAEPADPEADPVEVPGEAHLAPAIAPEVAAAAAGVSPGRDKNTAPADAVALIFAWEDYESLVVVAPGISANGALRPAWVVTTSLKTKQVAVSYRGLAYRDALGNLHIDCRRARMKGTMTSGWSPDSFAFIAHDGVTTLDDRNSNQLGTVIKRVLPGSAEFIELLRTAQALVAFDNS